MKIIFSKADTLLSRFIRFFDGKGKWSHVSIKVDEDTILDSRFPKGVALRPFNLKYYEVLEVEGNIDLAKQHIGKKYDLSVFFWYGIRYGDKPWNNPNQMICSELIATALSDESLMGMTPNQQYEYLKNNNIGS